MSGARAERPVEPSDAPPGARTALIAVGGNSLVRPGERASVPGERAHVAETCRAVAGLVADGWRVVLTHGNGPQVGAALRRSELAAAEAYPLPLDVAVATTQAEIGYLLQQGLEEALGALELAVPVVALLTRVRVSADDPAFAHPNKPVGAFMTADEAEARRSGGWQVAEEPPHGWRRVVPSPEPLEVLEEPVIRALLEAGVLVVALGGGGVPVARGAGGTTGVEAVVDKDLASALLALRLGVERFLVLTDVDGVYLDFGTPRARRLERVSASELERHAQEGHFPEGSMGPKVEAALRFVRGGGREAVIALPERLVEALAGREGTHLRGG